MERHFWPRRTFLCLEPAQSDYGSARIAILPVPYDAASSGATAGTREGPLAIVNASQEMELYDLELDRVPANVGIHTLPDVIPVLSGPADMRAALHAVARGVIEAGKVLVTLGGDHSISLGLVEAHLERYPNLGVLCLDAHADLLDTYLGTPYSHASVSRRIAERCPLVQVGVRSAGEDEAEVVRERRLQGKLTTAEEVRANREYIRQVVDGLPDEVYLSVDLDVLDPSIMAAVDLPEPGGLLWDEVLELVRAVAAERQIVGLDIVELSPRMGPPACAYLAARLTYKLIAYITANDPIVR